MNKQKERYECEVSVCMISYFHEAYIAQALESVLSQKTSFEYEIVICDDCSKDKTQEIIKEYAEKYSCIKYYFNEKNLGLTRNVFQAKCLCKGKYFVMLSGDDYWIDENKLQQQFEYLEMHPEYIGAATRIEVRTEDSINADFITPEKKLCNKPFSLADYLQGVNFPTNGLMLRNMIKDHYDHFSLMPKMSPYIDDETDCILILMLGDVCIIDNITVAYRRRIEKEGEHNFNSINKGIIKFEKHIALLNNLYTQFDKKIDLFNRYKIVLGPEIVKHYRRQTRDKFKQIYMTIPKEYKRRRLILKSLSYAVLKALDVFQRKYRR